GQELPRPHPLSPRARCLSRACHPRRSRHPADLPVRRRPADSPRQLRIPNALWHPPRRAAAPGGRGLPRPPVRPLREGLVPLLHAPSRRTSGQCVFHAAKPLPAIGTAACGCFTVLGKLAGHAPQTWGRRFRLPTLDPSPERLAGGVPSGSACPTNHACTPLHVGRR